MKTTNHKGLREIFFSYKNDWNKFGRDILNVHLDKEQQKILEAVQHHRRVSVRSGNARGKDFVAAVASVCFLNLNFPSKVINTGPTDRQVRKIMMTEIRKIYKDARFHLGGEIFENQIKFVDHPDWYLLAFKRSITKMRSGLVSIPPISWLWLPKPAAWSSRPSIISRVF
jgi:hypothetical protein